MQEMVEPDRTILIVSIIGLVVIWGSVAYHKFVQDGREALVDTGDATPPDPVVAEGVVAAATPSPAAATGGKGRGKGKKGRRR